MENEKRDRKFLAMFIACLFGFLTIVFWILYLTLGAESIPSVSSLLIFEDSSFDLPFEISRWWDVPALFCIVYVFILSKKNITTFQISLYLYLVIFLLLLIFNYQIFLPLFLVELLLGTMIGVSFAKQKDLSKVEFKNITKLIPKNILIGIWAGLSIGVGIFYGFAIGAILALVSTLSIWAFALVIIFGRKNIKLLVQTILATIMMVALATAFLFGKVLISLTPTLIAGVIFFVSGIILIILQSKKKVKE